MPIEVRLVVGTEPAREYRFDRPHVVVGCHPFNELVVSHGLSAKHGRLSMEFDQLCYEDLGGRGGSVVTTPEGETRLFGERCRVRAGDCIRLGDEDGGAVSLTILSFGCEAEACEEYVALPDHAPSTALRSLPPELADRLVDTCMAVAQATTLASVRQVVQALVEHAVPGARAAVVLPQGEQGFHDRVVVCDKSTCRTEYLTPESEGVLQRLQAGRELLLVSRNDRFELNLPIIGTAGAVEAQALVGYLRVTSSRRPVAYIVERLATVGVLLRPALVALLRSESLRHELTQLAAENAHFRTRARRHYLFKELVNRSRAMRELYDRITTVLAGDLPVLVVGEAGSGKKMVGRALHHLGGRQRGMLIAQNCGEATAADLDIELFGVADGDDGHPAHRGLFELADGGTLFLDEIDRMPLDLQTKLVRVLREREVRRVGDQTGRPVDVRVVAGTHRDLRALVSEGRFRRDLLAAFGDAVLTVPPLRERREDVGPLTDHFVKKYARRYGLPVEGISEAARARLLAHHWQGNVRELQMVVETAVLKAAHGILDEPHLELSTQPPPK